MNLKKRAKSGELVNALMSLNEVVRHRIKTMFLLAKRVLLTPWILSGLVMPVIVQCNSIYT